MLRISLCLLLTVALVSVTLAQQGHRDVQSLQYEFGKVISVPEDRGPTKPTQPQPRPKVVSPCPCEKPIVYAPVDRGCCCVPVCNPCYTPRYTPNCYPTPIVYRRAFVRPVYYSPYCR